MQALQTLMDEHRLIEQAIGALTAYAREVAAGAGHPHADLAELVAFIQGFADRLHHGKEENILFRAMAEHGMPTDGGPLAVMLWEHGHGREYTGQLAALADSGQAWGPDQREALLRAANGYGQLLLAHIQKEDNVLYPMSLRVIPAGAWDNIQAEFEAFDSDPGNAAAAADFRASAERLAARYR